MSQDYALPVLAELEAEALHILREAAGEFSRPALADAGGKAGECLRLLAERAFAPGAAPFATRAGADALIEAGVARQELWGRYHGRPPAGEAAHLFPLAHWTEADVAHYLAGEEGQQDLVRFVVAGADGAGRSALTAALAGGHSTPPSAYFGTARRRFIAFDAGGDVANAASSAEVAVIVVDAAAGIHAQTRRYAFLCSLLGVPRVVVAVNKMDLAGYSRERFEEMRAEFEAFAARLAFKSVAFIPVSALRGDNVARASSAMPWYAGEPLLGYLENVYIGGDRNLVDLRLPVQGVVRAGGRRWYLGRVESGVVKPGDEVVVLPAHRRTRVRSVRLHGRELEHAYAPLSVALALDEDIDVGRGAVIAHARNLPHAARALDAMVVWLDGQPLAAGRLYFLRLAAGSVRASCAEVTYRMDAESLHRAPGDALRAGDIGRASFTLFEERFVDPYTRNRGTGAFVVVDAETHATVGAGMIVDRESEPARVDPGRAAKRVIVPHASKVSVSHRAKLLGQSAVTVWLTGLSGAGKSTLATELENRLVNEGRACYMLDGDNVRAGINRDLGFGPDDRRENIRRIAEVARLMNDAGLITVTAFISPYRADRDMARTIIGAERFVEVFVDASLQVCESRDPKGLYRKARKGEIPEFTGISAPYEPPQTPALVVDTAAAPIGKCVDDLLALVLSRAQH